MALLVGVVSKQPSTLLLGVISKQPSTLLLGVISKQPRTAIQRAMGAVTGDSGPVETAITNKLTQKFNPVHLQVINESFMHNVPKGSETHFKVVVVSDSFDKVGLVGRHRAVNATLEHELKTGVHALSIVAKTVEQWGQGGNVESSPACRGGFGK